MNGEKLIAADVKCAYGNWFVAEDLEKRFIDVVLLFLAQKAIVDEERKFSSKKAYSLCTVTKCQVGPGHEFNIGHE